MSVGHPQTDLVAKKAIAQHFSRVAAYYDEYAFIQQEIGTRLLERCQWLKTKPHRILNIGCASGRFTTLLQKYFPKAQIVGIDSAFDMCQTAANKPGEGFEWFKKKPTFVCADMETLPFVSKSFDCIISNCTFEWSRALPTLALECKRVLDDNGTLLFTTVGPDTLYELGQSLYQIDEIHRVNAFLDMHHIGDILLKAGLDAPVMDREPMTVMYSTIQKLLADIKNSGSGYIFQETQAPLSKGSMQKLIQYYDALKTAEGYPATIEIIYGYAFKKADKLIGTKIVTANEDYVV